VVARRAHNPKVVGSNPAPATEKSMAISHAFLFMAFYVYVIESEEGYRYTGQTPDIERRLAEHNAHTTFSTKRGNNWRLVYSEEYSTRSEAMKRERYLKTGAGRDFLRTHMGVESAAADSSSGS
jgi:putative endonuclease